MASSDIWPDNTQAARVSVSSLGSRRPAFLGERWLGLRQGFMVKVAMALTLP